MQGDHNEPGTLAVLDVAALLAGHAGLAKAIEEVILERQIVCAVRTERDNVLEYKVWDPRVYYL